MFSPTWQVFPGKRTLTTVIWIKFCMLSSNTCACVLISLSAAGVGFIVVIDRRRDRWTCLKGTLLRISVSLTSNLTVILHCRFFDLCTPWCFLIENCCYFLLFECNLKYTCIHLYIQIQHSLGKKNYFRLLYEIWNISAQGWFPGNLRLVLVLRPSSILHRTLSDVFFKLHRDDFKVPVSSLNS